MAVGIMSQPTGIRRVVRDIADLCELQLELLAVDGKEATRKSTKALAILMIATVFGLAAVTAATFALASSFHEIAKWPMSGSLLAAGGIAALLAGIFAALSLVQLKKAMSALDETRSEFAENLRWIKAAIITPETSPRAQVQQDSFAGRYTSASRDYVR